MTRRNSLPKPQLSGRLANLDMNRIRAELEKRLSEDQFAVAASVGRAPLTMRRRAERARFNNDARYFEFLLDRAIRTGQSEASTVEQSERSR